MPRNLVLDVRLNLDLNLSLNFGIYMIEELGNMGSWDLETCGWCLGLRNLDKPCRIMLKTEYVNVWEPEELDLGLRQHLNLDLGTW